MHEMVHGMITKSELNMFFDDPNGYGKFTAYIDKLIDNFYQFSKSQYKKRKSYPVVSKVITRRRLEKKLRFQMPGYCERLRRWEAEILESKNISLQDLE